MANGKKSNVNTLKLEQNARHFVEDILKCIFLNKNHILIKISLNFVRKGPIDNMSAI